MIDWEKLVGTAVASEPGQPENDLPQTCVPVCPSQNRPCPDQLDSRNPLPVRLSEDLSQLSQLSQSKIREQKKRRRAGVGVWWKTFAPEIKAAT